MHKRAEKHFIPVLTNSTFYSVCCFISLGKCFMLTVLIFQDLCNWYLLNELGFSGLRLMFWGTFCQLCVWEVKGNNLIITSLWSAGGLFSVAMILSILCACLFRFMDKSRCLFVGLDRLLFWTLNGLMGFFVWFLLLALWRAPNQFQEYDLAWKQLLVKHENDRAYVTKYCHFLVWYEQKIPMSLLQTLPEKNLSEIRENLLWQFWRNNDNPGKFNRLLAQYNDLLNPDDLEVLKAQAADMHGQAPGGDE